MPKLSKMQLKLLLLAVGFATGALLSMQLVESANPLLRGVGYVTLAALVLVAISLTLTSPQYVALVKVQPEQYREQAHELVLLVQRIRPRLAFVNTALEEGERVVLAVVQAGGSWHAEFFTPGQEILLAEVVQWLPCRRRWVWAGQGNNRLLLALAENQPSKFDEPQAKET